MEGEETQQVAYVRKRLIAASEDQLTSSEIDIILTLYQQINGAVCFAGLTGEKKIEAMRDMLKPHLTQVWHGGPKCTCPHRRYNVGRKIYTNNEHAA